MPPLETFKPLKPMVFAGIYPLDPGGFSKLEDAIRRLTLTDRSVTVARESSSFLGQGFRLGFNGSLHMDVFRQRLEDEFDEEVIVTRPLVPVRCKEHALFLCSLLTPPR
jgi:translation elongation factor EF-4